MSRNEAAHFTGCLLGGAVGDALGRPVEFEEMGEIRERFGVRGIVDMVPGEAGLYEITDYTQMTLFTGEGPLRGWAAARHGGGVPDFAVAVKRSYLSWLTTQGEYAVTASSGKGCDEWLLMVEGLHRPRAPGNTCLSALREGTLSENG